MTPRNQDKEVSQYFDYWSDKYLEGYVGGHGGAHSFYTRKRRFLELLDNPGKILDVGCGPGVMVPELLARGYQYWGIDISEKMIEECRRRFGEDNRLDFSVSPIEELKFSDNFFDSIICIGVVEFISDDELALKEMVRVLKSGEEMIVSLPNRLSPYRLWDKLIFRLLLSCIRPIYQGVRRRRQPSSYSATLRSRIYSREYLEMSYARMLRKYHCQVTDVVYYNFKLFLSPLDRFFPTQSVWLSRRLEILCRSPWRFLGTSFIIKAKKLG